MMDSLKITNYALATVLFHALCSAQSVQLLHVNKTDDISSTCVSVLNQEVACDPMLAGLGDAMHGDAVFGTPNFLSSDELSSLCTSACGAGLRSWERRIAGACGSKLWNQTDGGKYAIAVYAENYVELYDTLCLKNRYADILANITQSLFSHTRKEY